MERDAELNGITERIIQAAMTVHSALGPGLLESAYEACLEAELVQAGVRVEKQVPLPIVYRTVKLDCGYRIDLLVEGAVVVEVKAVSEVLPVHEAQILSCLRLSGCRLGLLLNFHVARLKDGIRRFVSDSSDPRRSAFSVLSVAQSLEKEVS